MSKKNYFKKRFDFPSFSVIVQNHSLTYIFIDEESGEEVSQYIPSMFFFNELGAGDSQIQINWRDQWGSHILLTNYDSGSLKQTFEFVGRAFQIPFFLYTDFPAISLSKSEIEETIREEIDRTPSETEKSVEEVVEESDIDGREKEDQIMTGFINGFPSRVDIRVDEITAGIYCPVCGTANNLSNEGVDHDDALGMKCIKCKVQLVLHTAPQIKDDTETTD